MQELLQLVEGPTGLLTTQPACSALGTQRGNTYIEGLAALARHNAHWLRSPAAWKPRSHNVQRQFTSLASHLLAKHPVPRFMDSVWFRGTGEDAARQQAWYRAIARGQSPRGLDFPIPLTKRMASHFLKAPRDYTLEAALRWGQVLGLGGDGRLAKAILGSRIGAGFDNNEFWLTVIRWHIQNPMFDPDQVGPLIDYIHRQKFEPQEFILEPGRTETRPPDADFSMKGRTPASLLRQMREWHAGLRKSPEKPPLEWRESGLRSLEWTEGTATVGLLRRWTIVELLSRKALYQEGQSLRHCVASYDNSCVLGGTSIWSLGVERSHGRRRAC